MAGGRDKTIGQRVGGFGEGKPSDDGDDGLGPETEVEPDAREEQKLNTADRAELEYDRTRGGDPDR